MNKKMTRWIGLVLVLCLSVSLLSTAVFAVPDWDNPCASASYSDVDKDAWYHQAVDYVLKNNIMNGTNVNPPMFSPEVAVTRAMAVQVLFALAGKPVGFPDPGFTDLTQDWYKDAVYWAVANKIVAGYGDGTFGPEKDVTREQMALIFKAAAEYCRIDTSARKNLSQYWDAGSVSEWATEGMQWAISVGLMSGTSLVTLEPGATLTRAQLAQMLMRFHNGDIGTPGPAKVVGIAANYSGSTEQGTVLDRNNTGISVAAVYDDGHTVAVSDWNILNPATLSAGETSVVTVTSGAMQCELSVVCTTDPMNSYAASCISVTYDDLVNNPDAYKGKAIKVSGRSFSNNSPGTINQLYMIMNDSEAQKVKLYVTYKDTDTRISINDRITVYGEFRGMEGSYPAITEKYYTIDQYEEGDRSDRQYDYGQN